MSRFKAPHAIGDSHHFQASFKDVRGCISLSVDTVLFLFLTSSTDPTKKCTGLADISQKPIFRDSPDNLAHDVMSSKNSGPQIEQVLRYQADHEGFTSVNSSCIPRHASTLLSTDVARAFQSLDDCLYVSKVKIQ